MLYILGILTCKKNLLKAEEQYSKYLQDLPNYHDIIYVKFIGDPELNSDYIYDQTNNLLTLKCEDDYVNLPYKMHCFFKAIREIYPDLTNVFKTDDDIELNLENLYSLMTSYKDAKYAGHHTFCGIESTWMYSKTDTIAKYPELGFIPIYTEPQHYCGGGGYILNRSSVDMLANSSEYIKPFPKDTYKDHIKLVNGKSMFVGLYVFEDYSTGMILQKYNNVPITSIPLHELRKAASW
jgi:hypothetical protein